MEKISWTDHVRNEDVLLRVKEQRNQLLYDLKEKRGYCKLKKEALDGIM
jgi:hypothetical protein